MHEDKNIWADKYAEKASYPQYAQLINSEAGWVNRRIFWDQDIYQAELGQIFARCWLFLAHESQVSAKGDFVSTYMGEDNVLVVRQADGSLQAFLNSCPHRGNKVCFSDSGNAKGFICNYHGWSFGLDGALKGMPQSRIYQQTPGFAPCNHSLTKVAQIDTYKGLIFATFDPSAPSLIEYLGDFTYYLDVILDSDEGGTEMIPGTVKSVLNTNWKFAADNFAGDIYHAEWTHDSGAKAMLGTGVTLARQDRAIHASVNGHGIETSMDKFGNTRTLGEPVIERYLRSRWEQIVDRLGEKRALMIGAISSGTVFPNFSFLPGQNAVRVWQPKGPHQIELHTWVIVNKNMPTEVKEAFRIGTMMTFSPAGVFEMDDGENWEYATKSNRGHITRKQALCYTMGLGSELENSEFPGSVHRGSLNDANQRLFYQRWADLMEADSWKRLHKHPSRR